MDDETIFLNLYRSVTAMNDESEEENEAAAAFVLQQRAVAMSIYQHEHREVRRRKYNDRCRHEHAAKLMQDYFDKNCLYSEEKFIERFRMRRDLFNRIVAELVSVDDHFAQRYDARNMPGHTPHQKLTGALQVLCYGVPSDSTDDYVRMGKSTAYSNLRRFCSTMVQHFGQRYLRSPTAEDVRWLLEENTRRGFPGMLGSLDCMHWEWKNCPVAWHNQFVGHVRRPTIILQAVASYDLWFWHAFFGTPGSCNDLNVLDRSNLFDNVLAGIAPPANFTVNGHQYEMGYYLADEKYPKLATLVQSFEVTDSAKKEKFNEQQQAKRKDVERAFKVLKARFAIVAGPVKQWDPEELDAIMKTCIILHNMIIEDEHRDRNWTYVCDGKDKKRIQIARGMGLDQYTEKEAAIQDHEKHYQLRDDLVEHIWAKHERGEEFED